MRGTPLPTRKVGRGKVRGWSEGLTSRGLIKGRHPFDALLSEGASEHGLALVLLRPAPHLTSPRMQCMRGEGSHAFASRAKRCVHAVARIGPSIATSAIASGASSPNGARNLDGERARFPGAKSSESSARRNSCKFPRLLPWACHEVCRKAGCGKSARPVC
jgi:hypothetical protein